MEIQIDSSEVMQEILDLSEEILKDIETSRLSISKVALKASRLARLLGDTELEKIMRYEASGYPFSPSGVPVEVWNLGKKSGRVYLDKPVKEGEQAKERMKTGSLEALSIALESNKLRLSVSKDPDISSNASFHPMGNKRERADIANSMYKDAGFLAERAAYIHSYVLNIYYSLKLKKITRSTFGKYKDKIEEKISSLMPDEVKKLVAIHDNLSDENPEKWSNAMTSCRRFLKALADKIFPATDAPRKKAGKKIELKDDNVINRLICFIEDHKDSKHFSEITLSSLEYIGKRLDDIYKLASKGTHKGKITQEEAERCFLHTYMVIGDILMLTD